ncbi:hypothetical protein B0A48_08490 [Cryoendolithus antarcticus]|uniref:Stc1 domain-containing protein n=1 Tax=Cryoendolithus antarcticus TaxID=1507870 RepID=A0A1V8T5K9_9PEZI|nr:hypothetical protein B0A48_08490 [Cryoendolithus antarcticus]
MCPGPDPKKTCPNCGADKPLNEFPPDADTLVEHFRRDPRMKSGYKTKCKDCVKESDASKPTLPSGSRRICKGACGEDKPIEDYANDKSHPGGYRSKCKACEEGTEAKRVHNKPAKIPMPPGTLKTCKGTCGASKPIEDFQSPAPGYCLNSCKACNAPQPGSRKTCKGPRAADKPIEDFRKNGSGGYRPKCKDCMTDQGRSKPKESIPGKIVMPSGRRMKFTLTGSGTAGLATAQPAADDEDEGDDVHSTNPRLAELQRLYSNLFRRPTGANKRYARGVNYWPLSRKEILSRHTELGSSSLSKYDLVRALQRDEVAHGLLPIPRPVHSPYHFLSRDSLEILARSRAFTAFMNAENSRLASEFGEDRALSTQVGDGDAAMLDVDAAQPNINDLAAATDEAHSERLSVSAIDPRLRDFAKKSQSSATRLENDDVHDKVRD